MMFAFMQDQNSFSLKLRSKKYTRFGKSLAGRNAGMVKSFPMAALSELNFIVYKLDLIRSSSDLALAMQKCAYKWKVKYERKLNQGESKYLPFLQVAARGGVHAQQSRVRGDVSVQSGQDLSQNQQV